jgi:hypothetical protein
MLSNPTLGIHWILKGGQGKKNFYLCVMKDRRISAAMVKRQDRLPGLVLEPKEKAKTLRQQDEDDTKHRERERERERKRKKERGRCRETKIERKRHESEVEREMRREKGLR